ncbi:MAG: MMPL family transporter, partial [Syntrophales bacterium]|nr:MMPL family transporter [Syntrophales bacterium]
MKMHKYIFRWSVAAIVILSVIGLFAAGVNRLQFESDILASLPQNDPVLADARYIITHHPIYDRVVVDVAHEGGNVDILVVGADIVEDRMRKSGLFREVGFQQIGVLIPELMRYVTDHLPILFSEGELERTVGPLLVPEKIHQIMNSHLSSLQDLGGIGQSVFLSDDPLDLRNHVLARMGSLAPGKGARIQNGKLVSADGKHILVIAEPSTPGMDTRYAARIDALMKSIAGELQGKYGREGGFTLTPVGAYRAALDNETSAKRNVKKAVLFSTAAIVLLLLVGFPRPLIGLLSLLPAFAGTMMAYFVYSLFHPTISLLAVGFGGAIISFTVDYGITYLLFLDRLHETRGLEATKEVWSLGLLAMLTTAVSFAFLSLSGFPALEEIGQFAALGVLFTYIFVHAVFPLIFPVMPPAKHPSYLPLQRFVNLIASAGGTWKVYAALALGVFMLIFAKPEFRVDLNSMNAVSKEALSAEKLVRDVWGDIFSKVYLMVEGRDQTDFQLKCDRLTEMLERETAAGRIFQSFVSSMIFPGAELGRSNAAAWERFWNGERTAALRKALNDSSRSLGFSTVAFDPFFRLLTGGNQPVGAMPQKYSALFGIKSKQDGTAWTQVVAVVPGPSYEGEDFYRRFTASGLAKVFDPTLFTKRLGDLLLSGFIKMAAIIGIITILTAFQYFLDWRLTLIGM